MVEQVRRGRVSAAKARERDDRILTVALEEFIDHGYAQASLTVVAQRCRVSKSTIYRLCESKEKLLIMVTQHAFRKLSRAVDVAIDAGEPFEATVRSVCDVVLHALEEPRARALTRMIVGEAGKIPEIGRLAFAHVRELRAPFAAYLFAQAQPGALTENDARLMSDHLLDMATGGIRSLFVDPHETDDDRQTTLQSTIRMFFSAFPLRQNASGAGKKSVGAQ